MIENSTSTTELEKKAERLDRQLEECFVDPDGLIYNMVHSPGFRPYRAEDFSPDDMYRPMWKEQGWPTIEAWANYENTPHTLGCYLSYQSYRYQVTGEARCLDRAARTFDALKRNFEIGERVLERGYWPKPFGGLGEAHRSKDMTPDCNFGLVSGLDSYLNVAPSPLREEASEILKAIIDFYVKYDFDHSWLIEKGYRGLFNYVADFGYHVAPIVICYMKIAADRFGPDPYQRIYEEMLEIDNGNFNSRFETNVQMQKRLGDAYWSSTAADYFTYPDEMKAARPANIVSIGGGWSGVSESIGYLAEHDPDRADFFRAQAERWFIDEMRPGYAGDGWGYMRTMYDHHAKQRVPMSQELLERIYAEPISKPYRGMANFMCDSKLTGSPWVTATVCLHHANPDIGAGEFTKQVLLEMDVPSLHFFGPPATGEWPKGRGWYATNYLGPVFWLHTYYYGRHHRFW
jgi:hypothetical protein